MEVIITSDNGYVTTTAVLNLVDTLELRLLKKDAQQFLVKLRESLWIEVVSAILICIAMKWLDEFI